MIIEQYVININNRYILGNATENTFRGDLQQLLESLMPNIEATNEPKRQSCGAPDYILTRKDIPIGYIETKYIGDQDLDGAKKNGNKEQFDRYKASLTNIIFTDYINFHFYVNGIFNTKIAIAEVTLKRGAYEIVPLPNNFAKFHSLIKDFCVQIGQTITSPQKLAEMMARKARLLSEIIEKSLISDEEKNEDSTLHDQMKAFKEILIHDITPKSFADLYAQTIAYGMFAARLHDTSFESFSRQEAAELIPKSNPFLRKLFNYIAGPDIDDRIKWVVDSLVEIFLSCNVEKILKNYGKTTKMEDPIIHFYETFLVEYDPNLRKARGVWYTPQPVVNFIVRAVDDILKTEFDLPSGLADKSKSFINITNSDNEKTYMSELHKVQILDPATGTGTFLAEVIKHIYKKFEGQQGNWSNYVETHLLPRLNGFELLMASYAMAHLKLDLLLTETGYKPTTNQRFRVFLTNSLEEHHKDTETLFEKWLTNEANEANHIKRDTPVMCVIGNPPYSGISSNNGVWIRNLIEDYKYVDDVYFNERKHWLNDDYVKFLRYGQHFIEKNGSGILAYINPHGFLDNPTFRGMRWHLLKTFDTIYTIDLHGNSKKKETAPAGSDDVNVFDIQQGVSINIFIKTGKKKAKELGKVFHFDLFGKRDFKYNFLSNNSLKTVAFKKLKPREPYYFFIPKSDSGKVEYESGFLINDLFTLNNTGIVTGIDNLSIFLSKKELKDTIERILTMENPYVEFQIKATRRTTKEGRIEDLRKTYKKGIIPINYRPFDTRFTLPFTQSEYWINSPRMDVMQHFLKGDNLGLISARSNKSDTCDHFYITKNIMETKCGERTTQSAIFPLYLYSETNGYQTLKKENVSSEEFKAVRTPNLNKEIVKHLAEILGLTFINEKSVLNRGKVFAPIDILDYIYAVLHSPNYREKYKEFLKIDFPRIPYPKDQKTFWKLVKLGGEIRQIHLFESPMVEKFITEYPIDGNNIVTKIIYQKGKVFINDNQYFNKVPLIAWEFFIGGYQPAQKWLKDRKNRKLEYDDILHYQKIIVALTETHRLMNEINKIEIE